MQIQIHPRHLREISKETLIKGKLRRGNEWSGVCGDFCHIILFFEFFANT
jgi:hypothetical protein